MIILEEILNNKNNKIVLYLPAACVVHVDFRALSAALCLENSVNFVHLSMGLSSSSSSSSVVSQVYVHVCDIHLVCLQSIVPPK